MSTKCASLKYVYGYSVGVIQGFGRRHSNWDLREAEEKRLIEEKRKQPGVVFPSASRQEHLLIIRLNLRSSAEKNVLLVQNGLRRLCGLFKEMEEGAIKVDELEGDGSTEQYPLSKYNFSSTIGFGAGFFAKLRITRNKPKKLYEMPDHKGLRDPLPYVLLQTDLLIQLGSNRESINRWILQNDSYQTKGDDNDGALDDFSDTNSWRKYEGTKPKEIRDIVTAIGDWAYITDVHSGFQRIDGRNLMGFDDGVSNPDRLQNNVVWTADDDERSLVDGTYMVFQKIYHDLEQWRTLSITEQEKWVGRSKATGLLIGTLSKEDDEKLALDCRSPNPVVKRKARLMLKRLLSEQKDPENKLFDEKESIRLECPVWSHVRKSNPRAEGGLKSRIIYRRGYLFMEDTQGGKVFSGLLFICFQKNISEGFEYIKRNFLNNVNFPVPEIRMNFTKQESAHRHRYGRYTESELAGSSEINKLAREWPKQFMELLTEARMENAQNTGRDGLAGPSKLGINPTGFFPATLALGGGYYFIPPIPSKNASEIGQQFFE